MNFTYVMAQNSVGMDRLLIHQDSDILAYAKLQNIQHLRRNFQDMDQCNYFLNKLY